MHFEFIFVLGVRCGQKFSVPPVGIQLLQHKCVRCYPASMELLLQLCWEPAGNIFMGLFLSSLFSSIDLCVYPSVNITQSWLFWFLLYYSFSILPLLSIASVFLYKFYNSFIYSYRNTAGIWVGMALNRLSACMRLQRHQEPSFSGPFYSAGAWDFREDHGPQH